MSQIAPYFEQLVSYYGRRGFFRHVQMLCEQRLQSYGAPERDFARFWKSIAIIQQGSYGNDVITELQSMQNSAIMGLAITSALLSALKRTDSDAVSGLKSQLKAASRTKDSAALLFAANYFWLIGKHAQARQCLERVLGGNKDNLEALILIGWVNLTCDNETLAQKSLIYFNQALVILGEGIKPLQLLLGRAKWYELNHRLKLAEENIDQVIAAEPSFYPGLLEKARIQLCLCLPEDANETIQNALRRDPQSIDAKILSVFLLLTRNSDLTRGVSAARDLVDSIASAEPQNSLLYFDISRLLCAFRASHKPILELARSCIESAARLNPSDSTIRTQQAYQAFLSDDIANALQYYSEASQLDESNMLALYGMIRCKIVRGQLADAAHELEFLSEIQKESDGESESTIELLTMKAILIKKQGGADDSAANLFCKALEMHYRKYADVKLTPEFLISYKTEYFQSVIEELLNAIGSSPRNECDPPRPALGLASDILKVITRLLPSQLRPHLLLARVLFLDGKLLESDQVLQSCTRIDPGAVEPRMLKVQICIEKQNYSEAADALQEAISLNFEVQHTVTFNVVKSLILDARGQSKEALSLIQSAMNLPGVRYKSSKVKVPDYDRVSLFLVSAQIHAKQKLIPEAAKILQDARNEFDGSCEFDRILLADAELACSCRSDVDGALKMLKKIGETSPYLSRARLAIANIHLFYHHNRREYIRCFEELAQSASSLHTRQLLADAYLRIQEPMKAIKVFEEVVELAQSTGQSLDSNIYSRIGSALITCHDYSRAVAYYEKTIAENKNEQQGLLLSIELARLLFNLGRLEDAEKVVTKALGTFTDSTHSEGESIGLFISDRVNAFLLLTDIYNRSHQTKDEIHSLQQAYSLQKRVLDATRMSGGSDTSVDSQREKAGTIACQLGSVMKRTKAFDQVELYYAEAIRLCPSHEEALLALAQLKQSSGDSLESQKMLDALLNAHPKHEKAQLMLAEIKFKLNEQESAANYFKSILESNPKDLHALDSLIQCLKRSGQLNDAEKYLNATKMAFGESQNSCLSFIEGVVNLYEKKPRDALHNFNLARMDPVWSKRALFQMIDIYLNPEYQELISSAVEQRVESATQLLAEYEQKIEGDEEGKRNALILRAYIIIASNNHDQVNSLIPQLIEMVQADRDFVPAYLALAHAFLAQKDPSKARNQLKIIANMPSNNKYADEFERSWLMLAEMYITAGSNEMAQKLCRKALVQNRSSAKSWELLGELMNQEKNCNDAAQYFENAWQCHRETSNTVGYKLAFSYMNAKRFIEAIEVAHKILKKNPECTPLKTDVIDKCRMSIRV